MTAIVPIESTIPGFGSMVLEPDTKGGFRLKNLSVESQEVLEQAYSALRTLDRVAMFMLSCQCTKFQYMTDFPEPNPPAFVLPHIRAGLSHRDAVLVQLHTVPMRLGRVKYNPEAHGWFRKTCESTSSEALKLCTHIRELMTCGMQLAYGRYTYLTVATPHIATFDKFVQLDRLIHKYKELALMLYAENTDLGRVFRGILHAIVDTVWQVKYFAKYPALIDGVGCHVPTGLIACTKYPGKDIVHASCTEDVSVYAYTRHGSHAWLSVRKEHMCKLVEIIEAEYTGWSKLHQSDIKVDYTYHGEPVKWHGIEFHWGEDDITYNGVSTSPQELEDMLAKPEPSTTHGKVVEVLKAFDLY
jgi:hypothetical protein